MFSIFIEGKGWNKAENVSGKNSYQPDPFGNKTGTDPVFMNDHVPFSTVPAAIPSVKSQDIGLVDRKGRQQYNIWELFRKSIQDLGGSDYEE